MGVYYVCMNVEKPQVWSGLSRTVLVLASLVICIAGLKAAQSFFVPVLMAFFQYGTQHRCSTLRQGKDMQVAVDIDLLTVFHPEKKHSERVTQWSFRILIASIRTLALNHG